MADSSTHPSAVAQTAGHDIVITRVFDAPRERVWQAFTDPKLVAQWWGRGNKLVIERMEVEKGGHWRFVEHGPEGTRREDLGRLVDDRLRLDDLGVELVPYFGSALGVDVGDDETRAGVVKMPAEMPACVIENGTLETQRQRLTTLGNLSAEGFGSPAIVVVGEVVRFAQAATAVPAARAA